MISPSAVGIERIGPDRMAQTATFRKFQYNGSAIKKQDGGSPDFSNAARQRLPLQHTINRYPERKLHMQRTILITALLCASEAVVAQELTAEQRSACKGDYEKFCKGTTPGGGRIIACLSKSSDKLTADCKKVLVAAEKK
jgi:hypothetical protein